MPPSVDVGCVEGSCGYASGELDCGIPLTFEGRRRAGTAEDFSAEDVGIAWERAGCTLASLVNTGRWFSSFRDEEGFGGCWDISVFLLSGSETERKWC